MPSLSCTGPNLPWWQDRMKILYKGENDVEYGGLVEMDCAGVYWFRYSSFFSHLKYVAGLNIISFWHFFGNCVKFSLMEPYLFLEEDLAILGTLVGYFVGFPWSFCFILYPYFSTSGPQFISRAGFSIHPPVKTFTPRKRLRNLSCLAWNPAWFFEIWHPQNCGSSTGLFLGF